MVLQVPAVLSVHSLHLTTAESSFVAEPEGPVQEANKRPTLVAEPVVTRWLKGAPPLVPLVGQILLSVAEAVLEVLALIPQEVPLAVGAVHQPQQAPMGV